MNPVQQEPVATMGAAILAVFVAGIALLPTFGVAIDTNQQAALIAFVTSVITLGTVYQRSRVTPVDKANAHIEEAFNSDPSIGEPPFIGKK